MKGLRPSTHARTAYADDGQATVLELKQNTWTHLDATAAMLWRQLGEGKTISDGIQALSEHFGVSVEQLETDFEPAIQLLRTEKLLENSKE